MQFPMSSLQLSLAVLVLTVSVVSAWRVDCRKFVFAPKCRGVSAKRASLQSSPDTVQLEESQRGVASSFPVDESDNGGLERNDNLREFYELSRLQRQLGLEKSIWDRRNRLAKVLSEMADRVENDDQ